MTEMPAWDDLTELEKGTAVFFIRTVDGEGLEYAIENYPVTFRGDASDETLCSLVEQYKPTYLAMPDADFVRLYELGEVNRSTPASSGLSEERKP